MHEKIKMEKRFDEIVTELEKLSAQKEKSLEIAVRAKFDLSRIDNKIDELTKEAMVLIFELTNS